MSWPAILLSGQPPVIPPGEVHRDRQDAVMTGPRIRRVLAEPDLAVDVVQVDTHVIEPAPEVRGHRQQTLEVRGARLARVGWLHRLHPCGLPVGAEERADVDRAVAA